MCFQALIEFWYIFCLVCKCIWIQMFAPDKCIVYPLRGVPNLFTKNKNLAFGEPDKWQNTFTKSPLWIPVVSYNLLHQEIQLSYYVIKQLVVSKCLKIIVQLLHSSSFLFSRFFSWPSKQSRKDVITREIQNKKSFKVV